ncbi:hypothetical protein B0H16DRAFT_1351008 [Mycena metata]|uniref:Uncharacterized protein n=1 Tax=Mycena metata TaxID=1033252 RepID=A0AAD7DQ39_9AGAR|nr:hypothetical protein B0H16DRAFT_1351008 [Mycena metata]
MLLNNLDAARAGTSGSKPAKAPAKSAAKVKAKAAPATVGKKRAAAEGEADDPPPQKSPRQDPATSASTNITAPTPTGVTVTATGGTAPTPSAQGSTVQDIPAATPTPAFATPSSTAAPLSPANPPPPDTPASSLQPPAPASPPPSATLAVSGSIPAEAPSWLHKNVEWMQSVDLGVHFSALLGALVKAETAFGFDEETYGYLSTDHRPDQVQQWIKRGRAPKAQSFDKLKIKNVGKFAKEWGAWWDLLQPAWRRRDSLVAGGDAVYGADDEWDRLDTPGPNGCLSVVAGLFLWGLSDNSEELRNMWRTAVQDVAWMLEGLAQSMTAQSQRARGKKSADSDGKGKGKPKKAVKRKRA